LNNIRSDRYTVDAYVSEVETPIDSDTVRVHELHNSTKLGYYLSSFTEAARELRSGTVDLYHHMNLSYRWFNPLLLAGIEGDVPVVIGPCQTGHSIMREEFRTLVSNGLGIDVPAPLIDAVYPVVSRSRDSLLNPVRLYLFARTLRTADRIVVVHEDAKEQYSDFVDEDKLQVIPLGVDAGDFEFVERTQTEEFVAIGALKERKGYDVLIDSLAEVADSHSDVHLHVFGEGPLEQELRTQARELDIAKNITFHGFVDQSVLKEYLAEARAFVHPSRSESFSLVRLEAMAVGCPVIISDIPGAHEMVRNRKDGIVIPPESSEALTKAMLDVLGDFELAAEMGHNARERIEKKYDWQQIGQRYVELYEGLL
jgi:glycosyltransferase involved in cell wall biosynthesis